MTVEELVELLGEFDPEAEVRIGSRGFRGRVEDFAIADVDVLDDSDDDNPSVVYVVEGGKVG